MARRKAEDKKEKPQEETMQPAAEEKTEEQPFLERVVWRGKKKPPSNVTIGMLVIEKLPDEAAQREGFEHEHARELAMNIRDYKLDKPLGER